MMQLVLTAAVWTAAIAWFVWDVAKDTFVAGLKSVEFAVKNATKSKNQLNGPNEERANQKKEELDDPEEEKFKLSQEDFVPKEFVDETVTVDDQIQHVIDNIKQEADDTAGQDDDLVTENNDENNMIEMPSKKVDAKAENATESQNQTDETIQENKNSKKEHLKSKKANSNDDKTIESPNVENQKNELTQDNNEHNDILEDQREETITIEKQIQHVIDNLKREKGDSVPKENIEGRSEEAENQIQNVTDSLKQGADESNRQGEDKQSKTSNNGQRKPIKRKIKKTNLNGDLNQGTDKNLENISNI